MNTANNNMKPLGIVLIVVGLAMILIRGISVPHEKSLVDVGPVHINKTEHTWIGWPTYAGAIVAVAGLVVLATGKKR